MAGNAARITLDRTELPVSAGAVEAWGLEAHCIHIGVGRTKTPCFILDRLDQLRPETLAAKPLLEPEELDEQHRRPYFTDDTAYDRIIVPQRDRKPLVLLLAHLLGVVSDQTVEHRLLCLADGALDGNLRHAAQLS